MLAVSWVTASRISLIFFSKASLSSLTASRCFSTSFFCFSSSSSCLEEPGAAPPSFPCPRVSSWVFSAWRSSDCLATFLPLASWSSSNFSFSRLRWCFSAEISFSRLVAVRRPPTEESRDFSSCRVWYFLFRTSIAWSFSETVASKATLETAARNQREIERDRKREGQARAA